MVAPSKARGVRPIPGWFEPRPRVRRTRSVPARRRRRPPSSATASIRGTAPSSTPRDVPTSFGGTTGAGHRVCVDPAGRAGRSPPRPRRSSRTCAWPSPCGSGKDAAAGRGRCRPPASRRGGARDRRRGSVPPRSRTCRGRRRNADRTRGSREPSRPDRPGGSRAGAPPRRSAPPRRPSLRDSACGARGERGAWGRGSGDRGGRRPRMGEVR